MTRIFIGAWPDSVVRGQLAEYSTKCVWTDHARPIAEADFHLTLRFIGDVDLPRLDSIRAALKSDFDPIDIELARPQLWEEVAVLRPKSTPAALTALRASIDDKLGFLALATDHLRFKPHVTLALRAKHSSLPQSNPIAWHINSFCLVESTSSSAGRYRILETYCAR